MAKTKAPALEKRVRIVDEEDQTNLAAIDEGIADAKSGRTVPAEKIRELLRAASPRWAA